MKHLTPDQRHNLFAAATGDVLSALLRGEVNLLDQARAELARRGLDQAGTYVGQERARAALTATREDPLQARILAALDSATSGSATVDDLSSLLFDVANTLPSQPLFVVASCSGGHVLDLARDFRPMSDDNGDGVEIVRLYPYAAAAAEDAQKYSPGYVVRSARIVYSTGRAGEYAVDLEIHSGGGTYRASEVLASAGFEFGGVSIMQAALPSPAA